MAKVSLRAFNTELSIYFELNFSSKKGACHYCGKKDASKLQFDVTGVFASGVEFEESSREFKAAARALRRTLHEGRFVHFYEEDKRCDLEWKNDVASNPRAVFEWLAEA